MSALHKFYAVYENAHYMMADRGYESDEKMYDKDSFVKRNQSVPRIIKFLSKAEPSAVAFVVFFEENRTFTKSDSLAKISKVEDMLDGKETDVKMIVIVRTKVSHGKNFESFEKKGLRKVQILKFDDLAVRKNKHMDQERHEIFTGELAAQIRRKDGSELMPKVSKHDPLVIWYDLKVGDVIRYHRNDPNAIESDYDRVVS